MNKILKNDLGFKIIHFGLMLVVLLIATTSFFYFSDYTLHLPGKDIFANITFIVTIVFGIAFYFIIKIFNKKNIKLEYLYLCIIIPLGILYCIANPLGKIPDEKQHVRKSYMISKGVFFSEADEDKKPIGEFNSKIDLLVDNHTKSYKEAWEKIKSPETGEEKTLNYTMATYAPICHAPQAIGMFITRLFGGNLVIQCYVARLFNLAVAITFMFFAIRMIPFKKYIVFVLGLLPVVISEFASMSSDALTIASCTFFIAYVLQLKYDDNIKQVSNKDKCILFLTSLLIALCKIVYVPLCLLVFIIPKEKFVSKKDKNIFRFGTVIVSIFANLLWLAFATRYLTESNPGVDSVEQVKYILTHPISYFLILFRTIHIYNQTFILSLCGEGLGEYNAQASVLFTMPCVFVLPLLFLSNDDEKEIKVDKVTRILFTLIFIAIVGLVYTSLYTAWVAVRSAIIAGVQARYFIPILLLTIIMFDNKIINLKLKDKEKYIASFFLFFNLNALSCISYTYIFNYIIDYYIK